MLMPLPLAILLLKVRILSDKVLKSKIVLIKLYKVSFQTKPITNTPLCLQEVNPTIKFLPQVDDEASEPKIVSIDRVKVKSGLIIIDNPSGGEPGQKEYLVKSKRI